MTIKRLIALLILLACLLPAASSQCPGTPGTGGGAPLLDIGTNLWDSAGAVGISGGLPGAPWLLAADLAPGPTPTGVGNLCLGLSPAFFIVTGSVFGFLPPLDGSGSLDLPVAFPPSTAGIIGVPVFLQAAVLDAGALGGIALSNGFVQELRAPRVIVANALLSPRSADVFDAHLLSTSPGTARLASIMNQGLAETALSPDGSLLFTRDVTLATPNRARAFDISSLPVVHLADAVASPTGVGGSRRGVIIHPNGSTGWFCDTGGIRSFDADPASPTFMSLTGFATTSVLATDSIAVTPDGARLLVTAGSSPPAIPSVMMVIDTATMNEISTVPLTDAGLLLGLAQRGPVVVSDDGAFAATVSFGVHLAGIGPVANSVLSIVSLQPGPQQYTEIATVILPRAFQDDLAFDPLDQTFGTLYTVDADVTTGDVYLSRIHWPSGLVTGNLLTTGAAGIQAQGGVGTTPGGNLVFVATVTDDSLHVVDGQSGAVLQTVPLTSGGLPGRVHVERRP